jgi:serine phosphatase RsbU (regulator of sigma subunit)/DNA-binding winged helix-turn-helix (wHTH) protein
MFVTHGPLPPGSPLFVGRLAELKRMQAWLAEVNCVGAVLGARQTGKTSLLLKLRNACRDKYAFAFVDLQAIEGAKADECFNYIAEQMVEQLAETTDGVLSLLKGNPFPTFLREFAKQTGVVRIIVILDEVGALPPETAIKLASTIRAVFTSRFIKPEFARYMFLLAGATDMLELTTGRNSPLGNVTEKIYLGDLSLAETEQLLAEAFGRTWVQSFAEINRQLHSWASGHPYWTQLLAANLGTQGQGPTDEKIKGLVEHLLRTEDTNLPHLIRSLKADNALWILVESLLDGTPLSFSRANAAIAKLELIGILKDQDGRCTIRNRIYQEAVNRHQIKPVRTVAENLRVLNKLIVTAGDLPSLLSRVAGFVQKALQTRSVAIYTKGSRERSFRVSATVGIPETLCDELEFQADSQLLNMLEGGGSPPVQDSLGPEILQLRKMGSTLLVPVLLKSELLGFLSLGGKLSGDEYESQDREFLANVAERVAAGIERMLFQEWKIDAEKALDIQRALLPKEIPSIAGYQISGAWQPARTVSGDYYDVLKFDEHRVALCIGDVVGKGMPAALLMSNLQAAVRVLASPSAKPEAVCEQVNRLTLNNIAEGKFITFFYGLVDTQARLLTYTNAGHNPPIMLRRDRTVLRLDEGGAVLGVFPDPMYRQGGVDLVLGDRLLLFTDGVSEAQDSEGHQFGEERLIQLLKDNSNLGASDLQQTVIKTVSEFSRGIFHDDVTAIAMTCDRQEQPQTREGDSRGKETLRSKKAEGGLATRQLVRFGVFEVDLQAGELRKQGLKIRLQEKPFQVLCILLESPRTVVPREELQKRLWPNTIVEFEHNLNAAVQRLRDALGDSADNPRFIETIPRRGYRFVASVEKVGA